MKKIPLLISITAVSVIFLAGALSYLTDEKDAGVVIPLFFRLIILIPLSILVIHVLRRTYSTFAAGILFLLVFCGIGDSLITVGASIAGAFFFFIVHILNAVNFSGVLQKTKKSLGWKDFLSGVVIIISGLSIYHYFFYHYLDNDTVMQVMVFLYTLVLSIALWMSLVLYKTGNILFCITVFLGQLLFYITDVQVAYNELIFHRPANEWVNNAAYYTGLFLLAVSPVFISKTELEASS